MSKFYRGRGMNDELMGKIIRFGVYDTKKYRYRYVSEYDCIDRIELDKLGTTEAMTGWKTVARY